VLGRHLTRVGRPVRIGKINCCRSAPLGVDPVQMPDRGPSSPLATLLERSRRRERLSLREASDRVTEAGGQISHSTLLRIEQGRLQPGATELLRIATAYGLSREEVLDAVEAEVAGVLPVAGTLEEIVEAGTRHWKRGEITQALGCALALRDVKPFGEDQRALLQRSLLEFATYARGIGWTRLARRLLEGVLADPATSRLAARALVLGSYLAQISGSKLVAQAMIEHAARVVSKDDVATRAMVEHQRAKFLREAGDFASAAKGLDAAMRLYRRSKDDLNLARAGILRIAIVEGLRGPVAAVIAARRSVRYAQKQELAHVEAQARIELGRVLAAAGRVEESIRELRTALGQATLIGDPNAEFHAQYRLWKVYETAGDVAAAKVARQTAAHLAGKIDETGPEVEEVRDAATRR
jgi:tetratricopeptide (TPR) repeat protein